MTFLRPFPAFSDKALEEKPQTEHDKKQLLKMSLITGLAVALHNFPEGFATFIATVQDKVGFGCLYGVYWGLLFFRSCTWRVETWLCPPRCFLGIWRF